MNWPKWAKLPANNNAIPEKQSGDAMTETVTTPVFDDSLQDDIVGDGVIVSVNESEDEFLDDGPFQSTPNKSFLEEVDEDEQMIGNRDVTSQSADSEVQLNYNNLNQSKQSKEMETEQDILEKYEGNPHFFNLVQNMVKQTLWDEQRTQQTAQTPDDGNRPGPNRTSGNPHNKESQTDLLNHHLI